MKPFILKCFLFIGSWLCVACSHEAPLTVKEFAAKLENARHPQLLDARSAEEFARNRIKCAISVDMTDSVAIQKVVETLNPEYPTFTYSINSGRGFILAAKLRKLGFREVYALPGGLAGWVGAGYPLETSGENEPGLTVEQFGQIIRSNKWVLADFSSGYCGGCRLLQPVLDSLEYLYQTKLKIVRIELDDSPEIIKDRQIEALPTLTLFEQGKAVWKHIGLIKLPELAQAIREAGVEK
jgi:rhodanese-related sulfurtransferase